MFSFHLDCVGESSIQVFWLTGKAATTPFQPHHPEPAPALHSQRTAAHALGCPTWVLLQPWTTGPKGCSGVHASRAHSGPRQPKQQGTPMCSKMPQIPRNSPDCHTLSPLWPQPVSTTSAELNPPQLQPVCQRHLAHSLHRKSLVHRPHFQEWK